MKIESLAGLGVVKVECGSQFSVALTRSGSVYTWSVTLVFLYTAFLIRGTKLNFRGGLPNAKTMKKETISMGLKMFCFYCYVVVAFFLIF